MRTKRIQDIYTYVKKNQTVSLDELMEQFQVSKNTIRRDVQALVQNGELKKVHGGVSINKVSVIPYSDRKTINQNSKMKIAQLAASYINNGELIYIDSGTTTLEMLPFLQEKQITIVTNNLDFTLEAVSYPHLEIHSTGGIFERITKSYVGEESIEALKKYNFDRAFMASTGISVKTGITNSSLKETHLKKQAVRQSERVYILADASKFGKQSLTTYCVWDEVDVIVTDQPPENEYKLFSTEKQVEIIFSTEAEQERKK